MTIGFILLLNGVSQTLHEKHSQQKIEWKLSMRKHQRHESSQILDEPQ